MAGKYTVMMVWSMTERTNTRKQDNVEMESKVKWFVHTALLKQDGIEHVDRPDEVSSRCAILFEVEVIQDESPKQGAWVYGWLGRGRSFHICRVDLSMMVSA